MVASSSVPRPGGRARDSFESAGRGAGIGSPETIGRNEGNSQVKSQEAQSGAATGNAEDMVGTAIKDSKRLAKAQFAKAMSDMENAVMKSCADSMGKSF
jgi:hypothetical protein